MQVDMFGTHDNMFRFLLEHETDTMILKAVLMGPKPLEKKPLVKEHWKKKKCYLYVFLTRVKKSKSI